MKYIVAPTERRAWILLFLLSALFLIAVVWMILDAGMRTYWPQIVVAYTLGIGFAVASVVWHRRQRVAGEEERDAVGE